MKILRFNDDLVGVLKNGKHVVDISEIISYRAERGPQRVMEELIANFKIYREKIEQILNKEAGVPLDSVKLLAPIPRPSKCLAAFVNYLDKPDRTVENLPNEFFHKASDLVGPGGNIVLLDIPPVIVFHAETELGVILAKEAKNVAEVDAMDYVFGYVPFIDVGARGLIRRSQVLPKGQDTFAACGPWITTKDEIPDPHNLQVKSWLNKEDRQNFYTKDMAHKIPDQIAWLSKYIKLHPGDVIATGSYHAGIPTINPGDVMEIEIEKLGRASFVVSGNSPHKDTVYIAGKNLPPPTGMSITPVY